MISYVTITNYHKSWLHNYMSQKDIASSRTIILYYILIAYNIYVFYGRLFLV